jgi:hypothetical protein
MDSPSLEAAIAASPPMNLASTSLQHSMVRQPGFCYHILISLPALLFLLFHPVLFLCIFGRNPHLFTLCALICDLSSILLNRVTLHWPLKPFILCCWSLFVDTLSFLPLLFHQSGCLTSWPWPIISLKTGIVLKVYFVHFVAPVPRRFQRLNNINWMNEWTHYLTPFILNFLPHFFLHAPCFPSHVVHTFSILQSWRTSGWSVGSNYICILKPSPRDSLESEVGLCVGKTKIHLPD